MAKYKCSVCGYIYDEEKEGKPLLDSKCPVCGMTMVLMEENDSEAAASTALEAAAAPEELAYDPAYARCDASFRHMDDIHEMAVTGKSIIGAMGTPMPMPGWDDILLLGNQLNPPPLNDHDAVDTTTVIGKNAKKPLILTNPIFVSHMSFGALSKETKVALAKGSALAGAAMCSGEGGILPEEMAAAHKYIFEYIPNLYSVTRENLRNADAIEIKIGQGAKPGIGGHLPGTKIVGDVSRTRMIPEGSDAISPAPHHDIYSIEDLRQLIFSLKEATEYKKPVIVKVAAVHNIAAIASGIARGGADIIAIDGFRGGTGAAPTRIRDNVGIPIELALAAVDQRLREEGIRDRVSLIAGGSIRSAADVVKAVALGADACYIGTAALIAMGCHLCRSCQSGRCAWGIATQRPELVQRLDPEEGATRLVNLMTAWKHEIREMMGGMGINSIEALRGNRLMLRAVGLTDRELAVLGVAHAGE